MSFAYPELLQNREPKDAFGMLRQIRRDDPVLYLDQIDPRCWFISRHEDIVRIFNDERFEILKPEQMLLRFSEEERRQLKSLVDFLAMRTAVFEQHDVKLRYFARSFFSPAGVKKLEGKIRELAVGLIDKLDPTALVDFTREFSKPLPAITIATLLGADPEDLDDFVEWSNKMIRIFTVFEFETYLEGQAGIASITNYCADLIERRIREPIEGDLLSHFGATALSAGYSRAELAAYCAILLMAGHETTTTLFNGTIDLLSRHPDQLALAMNAPTLMPGLIDEVMRFRGVGSGLYRMPSEELTYLGHSFEPGQLMYLSLLSANHDERVFDDPDSFDIRNTQSRNHLSFGRGRRFCLGSHLAKLEACIGLGELYDRYPDLQVMECEKAYSKFCQADIKSLQIQLQP